MMLCQRMHDAWQMPLADDAYNGVAAVNLQAKVSQSMALPGASTCSKTFMYSQMHRNA